MATRWTGYRKSEVSERMKALAVKKARAMTPAERSEQARLMVAGRGRWEGGVYIRASKSL